MLTVQEMRTFASAPTQGQGSDEEPNLVFSGFTSRVLSRLSLQLFWIAAPKHFGTNFREQAGSKSGMV